MKLINSYYLAVCQEAVMAWDHPDRPHIQHLVTGEQIAVWITADLAHLRGTDSRATTSLLLALARQAGRYEADGLSISAGDCYWLMAKIRGGSIMVIEKPPHFVPTTHHDIKYYRNVLVNDVYRQNLRDEDAPSLQSVQDACHADAVATVKLWSDVDVINAYQTR